MPSGDELGKARDQPFVFQVLLQPEDYWCQKWCCTLFDKVTSTLVKFCGIEIWHSKFFKKNNKTQWKKLGSMDLGGEKNKKKQWRYAYLRTGLGTREVLFRPFFGANVPVVLGWDTFEFAGGSQITHRHKSLKFCIFKVKYQFFKTSPYSLDTIGSPGNNPDYESNALPPLMKTLHSNQNPPLGLPGNPFFTWTISPHF